MGLPCPANSTYPSNGKQFVGRAVPDSHVWQVEPVLPAPRYCTIDREMEQQGATPRLAEPMREYCTFARRWGIGVCLILV